QTPPPPSPSLTSVCLFFSSRRRHTRSKRDWSSDVCSSDLKGYYFIHPTVLKNANLDMVIMHEETFGPVIPIIGFKEIEEAVEIANDTPFGLAAYFFTQNYQTGIQLYEQLEYGIIAWNDGAPSASHAPFCGMKESGFGREGGLEGIEPYLETKYLSIGGVE